MSVKADFKVKAFLKWLSKVANHRRNPTNHSDKAQVASDGRFHKLSDDSLAFLEVSAASNRTRKLCEDFNNWPR